VALADTAGLDYVFGPSGADACVAPTESILALLGAARRLRVVAPVSTRTWHPALLARFGTVAGRLSGGRFAVELTAPDDPADTRTEEFARILHGLWIGATVDIDGRHYRSRGLRAPRPVPGATSVDRPQIVVTGAATPALMPLADWLLTSTHEPAPVEVHERDGSGQGFGRTVPASELAEPPEVVAERIVEYRRRGTGLLLLDFPNPESDLPRFGRQTLPLVHAFDQRPILAA
jgi:alkanesulfonate monooxygenase SsuD/methylene tetrahydromethanopterin reductase-like flavin-dependent oxidoreductase (luciferase family)